MGISTILDWLGKHDTEFFDENKKESKQKFDDL